MRYLMRPSTDGAIKVGVLKASNLLPKTLFQTLRVRMVSAAGFEPTAPGFIPLRLSPPPLQAFVVWTVPSPWAEAFRRHPSSLYTFPDRRPGLARD